MKSRNPFKRILSNAKSAQSWNQKHQDLGVDRPVRKFFIVWEDVEMIFYEQNGLSKWLEIPMDPEDVFRSRYPLSPSLDRLDNEKDYTVDNICISTRFENFGFNKCNEIAKAECVAKLIESLKKYK